MAGTAPPDTDWLEPLKFVQDHLSLPPLITEALAVLVLAGIFHTAVSPIAKLAWRFWKAFIRPRLTSSKDRQRAEVREQFAKHLRREIEGRNRAENWRDELFAELEAEVEVEGGRRGLLPFRGRAGGTKREASLSRALESNPNRLVLVEGDPGSGKSVALRHVAFQLADRAARSGRRDSLLPVFVNLRELTRKDDEPVDRELIRSFVLKSMNRVNDRYVAEFLEVNFDDGIKAGTWVFLFDSFDEIPEVLSSTESDEVITAYSAAIDDFLSGINNCRGVIASRGYRGPRRYAWCKFRILELSQARQARVVRLSFMNYPERASEVFAGLAAATDDVRAMASNAMLLGLLCEHVRLGQNFPETAFEVFARYIDYRLARDAEQVRQRYRVTVAELRSGAEAVAFTMTADRAIGLAPKRAELLRALQREGFETTEAALRRVLDALEYMRLGRTDTAYASVGSDQEFTFAHRRFQEYFATNIVIADPGRVPAHQLLTDARWRETAVVLCQTGRPEAVEPLQQEASDLILASLRDLYACRPEAERGSPFPWPRGTLHVLSILQTGFGEATGHSIEPLRTQADALLRFGFNNGDLLDKRLVMEVAAIVPPSSLLDFVRASLANDSEWLNDAVFRQVARLSAVSDDVAGWIRGAVLRLAFSRDFGGSRSSMRAFAARLPDAVEMQRVALLASWILSLDFFGIALATTMATVIAGGMFAVLAAAMLIVTTAIFALFRREQFVTFVNWRAYIVGWLLFTIVMDGGLGTRLWVAFGIVAYAVTWTPSAMACARRGVGTRPTQWPWAPVLMAGLIVRAAVRLFLRLGKIRLQAPALLRRVPAVLLGTPLRSILSLAAALIVCFWIGWVIVAPAALTTALPGIAGALLVSAVLLFWLYMLFTALRYVIRWIRDRRLVKHWLASCQGGMGGEMLASEFATLRTDQWRLVLLQNVRKKNLLKPSSEGGLALRQLGRGLQKSAAQRDELFRLADQLVTARAPAS